MLTCMFAVKNPLEFHVHVHVLSCWDRPTRSCRRRWKPFANKTNPAAVQHPAVHTRHPLRPLLHRHQNAAPRKQWWLKARTRMLQTPNQPTPLERLCLKVLVCSASGDCVRSSQQVANATFQTASISAGRTAIRLNGRLWRRNWRELVGLRTWVWVGIAVAINVSRFHFPLVAGTVHLPGYEDP